MKLFRKLTPHQWLAIAAVVGATFLGKDFVSFLGSVLNTIAIESLPRA